MNRVPYIIKQIKQVLAMEVNLLEVNYLSSALQSKVVICCFNGLWNKYNALYQWVISLGTTNYYIYSCSKGFFIVQFET